MSSGGEVRDVLAFWFGEPGTAGYGTSRPAWFRKDPAFDGEIRRRFLALHARAAQAIEGGAGIVDVLARHGSA